MDAIEIRINEQALAGFVEEGGKLMVKKEANDSIMALLRLQNKLETYIRKVKDSIVGSALAINPTFKGVFGKDVKGIYKTTGRKYSFDKNMGDTDRLVSEGLLRPVTTYVPVSEKIEALEAEGSPLPAGIVKNERSKDLYFQVKDSLLLDDTTESAS